jgi:uncharacterized damage-inducible protein DinB
MNPRILLLPTLLFLLLVSPLKADDPASSGFITDYIMQVEYVQKQILELEGAVPQEKFSWRPAEGVRSIAEAYLHIAFANYGLLKVAGFAPPEDVAAKIDFTKIAEWDGSTQDKKAIEEAMVKSFAHVKSKMSGMSSDDLERKVDFFGNMMTIRNMFITGLAHMHEHLGQSIAYARMNGVTPPWSESQPGAK